MGLHVAAVDVDDDKLELARRLGAAVVVNARGTDPAAYLKKEIGGAHGVLVTAASPRAFEQALGMVRRGGTIVLTRLDLQEALDLAGEGAVRATVQTACLEDVNDVFERLHSGQIEGRVVLDLGR